MNETAAISGAADIVIVDDNDPPVGAQVGIQFNALRTLFKRQPESRHGIFGGMGGGTPMGKDNRLCQVRQHIINRRNKPLLPG